MAGGRVSSDAEQYGLSTCFEYSGGERDTIAVNDLAGSERLADVDQFVARGKNRDARLAKDRHMVETDGGGGADLGGTKLCAGRNDDVSSAQVLTGATDMLTE